MKTSAKYAYVISTNIIITLLGVITSIIIARTLGPVGRGELTTIILWPTLLGSIGAFGINEAIIYYSSKNDPDLESMIYSSMVFMVFLSMLYVLLGYFFTPLILKESSKEVQLLTRLYFLSVPITFVTGLISSTLRGKLAINLYNLQRISISVIYTAAIILIWVLGFSNISSFVFGQLASFFLFLLLSFYIFKIDVTKLRCSFAPFLRTFKYGLKSQFNFICFLINAQLIPIILSIYYPPGALGIYTVALVLASTISPVVIGITAISFPIIGASSSLTKKTDVINILRNSGVFIAGLTFIVFLSADPLIYHFYGNSFIDSIMVCKVLLIGYAFWSFHLIMNDLLRGLNMFKYLIAIELLGLLISLLAIPYMLWRFGLIGAAIGFSISAVTIALVQIVTLAISLRIKRSELIV